MNNETKIIISLTMDEIQTIVRMFDIATRTQGINVINQISPVLDILSKAIQENETLETPKDIDNG